MEIVVVVVEVLKLVFEVCVLVGIAAWRYPRYAVILVGLVAAALVLSPRGLAAALFYTPLVLAGWYGVGWVLLRTGRTGKVLALYRGVVGRRLHSWWRRWWLYERRWVRTLAGLHLTEPIDFKPDRAPKLKRVRTGPFGDTLKVKVLHGQTARDFTGLSGEVSRALAKAFKARDCTVRDEPQSDYITIWLPRGRDPLADPVPFPGVPKTAGEVDLSAIPIGVDERGRQVTVPVLGAHLLIASITGGGKGSAFYSILLHLEPHIRAGSVRVVLIDPKRGVELFPIFNAAWRYEDRTDKEIGELLAEMVTVMDKSADRLKAAKVRKLTPTPDHPLYVVFVDELGRLSDSKEAQGPLRTLINVGRAPGVSVIGALQNPTKETAKFRDEIPVKWVGRMESAEYVRLTLGREAYLNGARCDEIPMSMPGAGYIKIDRLADPDDDRTALERLLDRLLPWRKEPGYLGADAMEATRMRLYHVTDDLIEQVNESFAPAVDDEPAAVVAPVALVGAASSSGGGGEFDEGKVVRDPTGRFAPKGQRAEPVDDGELDESDALDSES